MPSVLLDMEQSAIRVLIVYDIRLYAEGLASLLRQEQDVQDVKVVSRIDAALSAIQEISPNVVLLSISIPERLAMLRMIVMTHPNTKVVALCALDSNELILACAEAGAAGYLSRGGSFEELRAIIRSVLRGEAMGSLMLASALRQRWAIPGGERRPPLMQAQLTPRQSEVIKLIDTGLSNKEIAQRLHIQVHTVKNHVHNILEKLQVHRRGEAAAKLRCS